MTTTTSASTRSATVCKFAWLAVLVGLAIPATGFCSGANPLIGSWKFSSTNNKFGASGCNSAFVFAAKTATITTPPSNVIPAGSVSTMAVHYVAASPNLVSVVTNGAGHVNYNIVDSNHMYTEDPWGKCYFVRTN